jgi:hypothetical protein
VRLLAAARWRLRAWLGDERVGMLDYWRRPGWRASWGGPFNGQVFRQQLFVELCSRVPFVAVVETGTYRGTTTMYFRRATRVPVHSFESKPRHYGFARAHLWRARGVSLYREDSRAGLARLAAVEALPAGPVFFYFDAHGQADLPLSEEVDLAFAHWPQAVIMIDDFAVPDDPGYAFDDYGPGKALTLAYLGRRAAPPVAVWFPACASSSETGARRGSVVLARDAALVPLIDRMRTLRRWPASGT